MKEKRLEKETPVWEWFFKWLGTLTPAGGSRLEKAVNYARNHRETLCNYLLDGRCEIFNNTAERCAKSYAIGRKAFLFHMSEAGASAVMYSIIETAKSNSLNVFQYLYMVLLYMPDYKNEPAGIEMLLPWSDFIKGHCSGLIDVEKYHTGKARSPANLISTGIPQGERVQYGVLFIAYVYCHIFFPHSRGTHYLPFTLHLP